MGGQAAIRGYLVQTMIALVEALDKDQTWEQVTLEPDHPSEKIDVLWNYGTTTKAVQVKSSQNQINKADAERWAGELASTHHAADLVLTLVGPYAQSVVELGKVGKVTILTPGNVDLANYIEVAAHRLDRILKSANLAQGTADSREMLARALVGQLAELSAKGTTLSREELVGQLRTWVAEASANDGRGEENLGINQESLLDVLRRKLDDLQKAEAITADPSLRFQLQEQIKDARLRIDAAMQNEQRVVGSSSGSQPGDRPAGLSSDKLRSARDRVKQLTKEGADQAAIDAAKAKVLEARREIREGGRLRPEDVLLDRYELLECVGRGGFATVWKCFDEQTMKVVAAKILHPSHREERTRIDRFFRGARMMKQLSHQNIVRVLDERCSDEGFHFYIMEFIDGDDFHQAVLSGRISGSAALDVILSAADALHHAHTTLPDLVHRDVKPSNILLTSDGQVRVTDFDLVRTADTTGGTRTGSLGTFMYTAPESLQKAGEVDARADVFSLGMTTIFGLYGHELPVTAFRHTSEFIDSLDCTEGIKQALKQAVEWEPSERFASMQAFAEAIRNSLQDDSSSHGSPLASPKAVPKGTAKTSVMKARKRRNSSQVTSDDTVTNSLGMQLKLIPEGEFMMGSETEHRVRITNPFYLGVYTVTQEQYEQVMEARPWQGKSYVQEGPDYPAVYVSHDDAVEFCRKLSEQEGVEYRLPTEAQWEYACRAGTTSAYSFDDDASELGQYAWYRKNAWDIGEKYAHRVGQKLPNAWGLYDMHGNVWEWCQDWYGEYEAGDVVDPSGPATGNSRVLRGGSFLYDADDCRSPIRLNDDPGLRGSNYGFRVSRTYP